MAQPARINQVVAAWVAEFGVKKCIHFSKQPGGWEEAAQNHLVRFFRHHIPCPLAQREVKEVFTARPGQSVDFFCVTPHGVAPSFHIIELKCQSTYQDSVRLNHFAGRLQEDIDKVNQVLNPSSPGAEKWVIGICCNMELAKATVVFPFTVNGQPHQGMSVILAEAGNDVVQFFYAALP